MERIDQIGLPGARHEMRLEIERRDGPIEVLTVELAHPAGERGRRGEGRHALEEPLARRVRGRGRHARVRVPRRERHRALGEVERLRAGAAAVVIDVPRLVPPAVGLAGRLDAASPPRVERLVAKRARARRAAALVFHASLNHEGDKAVGVQVRAGMVLVLHQPRRQVGEDRGEVERRHWTPA